MLKYVLFSFIFFTGLRSFAQIYDRYMNKKFDVKQQQNNTTTLYLQGKESVFYSNKTIQSTCAVNEVFPSGYELKVSINLISGYLNAFGQEQEFNTTKQSTLRAEDSATIQSLLNKVQIVKVRNHQQIFTNDTSRGSVIVTPDNVTKYFLAIPDSALKLGYSWSDSTTIDSSKTINEYIINNMNADSLQIIVYSVLQQRTIVQQQNQQLVQQLKGYSKAERWYSIKGGLLKREVLSTTLNGISKMYGQSFPISIKINTQTFLQEKR